ncbi:HD domain-containing phosphohydrolase [Desulfocurvibacter africanus]|uniref:Putative PAS/PAC sensor protein n=1 Tax=Desulfocurvibacter africanus subsp. africanus str. Walvis Bay TaxID=690850 RepID=F3Z0Y4_DESAF|nr:HD domain-containing phosphohydrolase [Desulfocurvibacter africanus]EGJ51062.1 putative PAS/PAC sensor protein [Desulfocurvibacter africanus subsp. africanus str. Walvis Bay]
MIVEDEAIVALDIQNRLRLLGYEIVTVVSSGEEALEAAARYSPELILMDIMLDGDIDGIEAAAIIRERHRIPLVYLTAYADEKTLQRAKITEPFGYIIKPFEDRELGITIEMALYKHTIERKLVESERWLATTLNSIGDAVLTTDERGRVKYLNPAALRILGCEESLALGKDLSTIFALYDPKGVNIAPDLVSNVLDQAHTVASTDMHTLVTGPQREVPVNMSHSPIISEGRSVRGTVLVLHDITERREAEYALQKSVSQLKTSLEETVNALAVTSEKRDPYTAGHQQRVSQLACAMAREQGLPKERIEGIRVAAILHDLGKIYVPAEILAKPTRLTQMEMGIMKTHAEVGFDILKNIPFPWPVAAAVLQHHERMDGSGYPNGLSDKDICCEARIISVADVVEAMSSHRPYRAALGIERALEEIARNRERLYDAECVDICLSLFRDKGFQFTSDLL